MKKADYYEYLKSEAWSIRRKWKLEQAEHRCQVCNGPDNLRVHHRTYDRVGQERENDLTVLCDSCHRKHHGIEWENEHLSKELVLLFEVADKMEKVGLLPKETFDWLPWGGTCYQVSTLEAGHMVIICTHDAPIWDRPERVEIGRKLSAFLSYEVGVQVEVFWSRREDNAALLLES